MSRKRLLIIVCMCILQFAVATASYAQICLHPSDWEDSKCIYDYAIPCSPGFYNIMTEGNGYGLGKLTYEELVNFFCRPCQIGYYCPGDNRRHECENAEKTAMDVCPDISENVQKHIDSLKDQQKILWPF